MKVFRVIIYQVKIQLADISKKALSQSFIIYNPVEISDVQCIFIAVLDENSE